MEKNVQLSEQLSKQIYWLKTWKTKKGGYNGFVVHRHNLKRMFKIHDTPWSQGPIISGYTNLYLKTNRKEWLNEAISAADLQCTRICETGKYIYAGFEDDRFSSLIHNSLANCALLDLAEILIDNDKERSNKYLKTVINNVEKYIISTLWHGSGLFKFSEIDYYTPDKIRFVVNMNSVTAECLIKLSNLTGDKRYNHFAITVGEWMLGEQVKSCGLDNGGINYSQIQPGNLVSIYTALSMRGIDDLYYLTNDERYREYAENAYYHLIGLIDTETKLFYHGLCNGKLLRFPQFIAGSGIILKALDDIENIIGKKADFSETFNAIMDAQHPNGGFPNFKGYRNKKNIKVWEDDIPVMGWNAHLFEYLTRKIDKNFNYVEPKIKYTISITKNYIYFEYKDMLLNIGIRPLRSIIIYFLIKKIDYALIYISFNQLEKLLLQRISIPGWIKRYLKKYVTV